MEIASLRGFPQQIRTIELVREAEATLTIRAIDVDPVVEDGAPADVYNADLVMPLSAEMRRLLDG